MCDSGSLIDDMLAHYNSHTYIYQTKFSLTYCIRIILIRNSQENTSNTRLVFQQRIETY